MEQQIRAELAVTLWQSGGDLCVFVAALGIPFRAAPGDRRASMKAARAAAMQRLHPDKLQQGGERQQAFGMVATQLLNELWAAAKPM